MCSIMGLSVISTVYYARKHHIKYIIQNKIHIEHPGRAVKSIVVQLTLIVYGRKFLKVLRLNFPVRSLLCVSCHVIVLYSGLRQLIFRFSSFICFIDLGIDRLFV